MTKRRLLACMLAVCTLFSALALPTDAANPGGVTYLNTHVNTGNQREDILAVAFTQLGYMEKDVNDTKYGDWFGYPGQQWCAMFVSWCARQAEVSTDILKRHSWAHPNSFGIDYYHGSKYTPKPGDLFFTEEFNHVGIVWYVEGDFFYCIEGNAKYHDYRVPNDPSVESYHVMTNKRLISAHYFGVPEYEGCDKDHSYVRGVESAHPHKAYYKCSTCGDKFYTGYTECKAGCSKCFTCGCSSSKSGWYLVSGSSSALKMRNSHSTSASYIGYATVGEAVYVHGMNTSTGWAYIEYDGQLGHIQTKYLTKYHDIPASPKLSADKADYSIHDNATVSWTAPANTEQYRLKVYRDGALYKEQIMDLARTITLKDLPKGTYQVEVIACNRAGASAPGTLTFTVRDTYTLTYDAAGGTGAPAPQTQLLGQDITVSQGQPVRTGYTFLGWTAEPAGTFVQYVAGDTIRSDHHLTLYAVWRSNDAALESMTIAKMPRRTMYLLGQELDTTGLTLELHYADGSGHLVTDGFTAEGFDSTDYGTRTITIAREGLTVTYEVQVVPRLPGDLNVDFVVDEDDAIYLLQHILLPDFFPVEEDVDYNGDGQVNEDDAIYLLQHVLLPDFFPL